MTRETITAAQYRELTVRPFADVWRKYRNKPTMLDGKRFDSKREAYRHAALEVLERVGRIEKLERQVSFDLVVQGVKVGRIKPDWTYIEDGHVVAEDSKGVQTDVHRLRWKLAKVLYPQIEWRLS